MNNSLSKNRSEAFPKLCKKFLSLARLSSIWTAILANMYFTNF